MRGLLVGFGHLQKKWMVENSVGCRYHLLLLRAGRWEVLDGLGNRVCLGHPRLYQKSG